MHEGLTQSGKFSDLLTSANGIQLKLASWLFINNLKLDSKRRANELNGKQSETL